MTRFRAPDEDDRTGGARARYPGRDAPFGRAAHAAARRPSAMPWRRASASSMSAMAEFAEHGYSGSRIDRISVAADVNVGMIYHYFGSKDDLYLAALEASSTMYCNVPAKVGLQEIRSPTFGTLPPGRKISPRSTAKGGSRPRIRLIALVAMYSNTAKPSARSGSPRPPLRRTTSCRSRRGRLSRRQAPPGTTVRRMPNGILPPCSRMKRSAGKRLGQWPRPAVVTTLPWPVRIMIRSHARDVHLVGMQDSQRYDRGAANIDHVHARFEGRKAAAAVAR